MRALMSLLVALALPACAEQPTPEEVADERLVAGDQRLIGYAVTAVGAPAYNVIGVKCETTGFPLRVLEARREARDADREIKAAARFNRALVADDRYTQAVCEPFDYNGWVGLAPAVGVSDKLASVPTESFQQIFGFPAS